MAELKGYLNAALCAECQGECCKTYPGICSPDDFKKPLLESLVKAFRSGKYSVDWWESDPRGYDYDNSNYVAEAYYVRPATIGYKGITIFEPSWGGQCILLMENGCELPFEKRPVECRMLKPSEDKNCGGDISSKRDLAIEWLDYTDIILEAIKITKNKETS